MNATCQEFVGRGILRRLSSPTCGRPVRFKVESPFTLAGGSGPKAFGVCGIHVKPYLPRLRRWGDPESWVVTRLDG